MPNNVNVRVGTTGAGKASSEVDQLKDKFSKLQSQGAKGFAIGAGAAVTGVALGVLGAAAGQAGQFLSDATQAAIEEEASIQKLGSSLKANIPNWDGNTAAIERTLAARMSLGFSDDEQRQSLAMLVVATHDATKALDIQRTAMDLARLKGISLADASGALIKVEGGQFRALKALGIVLKDGATQTDALAAVQKAASGQAEDYANTNAGKLLVSQVKVGEAMEKFGAITMPLVVAATMAGADVMTQFADAVGSIQHPAEDTGSAVSDLWHLLNQPVSGKGTPIGDLAGDLNDALGMTGDMVTFWDGYVGMADRATKRAAEDAATASAAIGHSTGKMQDDMHGLGRSADDAVGPIDRVAAAADHMASRISSDAYDSKESIDKLVTGITSDVNDLIDKAFDPAIKHDEMWATARELAAQRAIVASHKSTKEQKRDAADVVTTLTKKLLEEKVALLEMGALSAKEQAGLVTDLKTQIKNATGPTKTYLQGVLDKVRELQKIGTIPIKISTTSVDFSKAHHAAGGPVQKGDVSWVGENGPELMQFGGNAFITPADVSKRAVSAGGGSAVGSGGFTLNVTINASPGMTPGDSRALVAAFGPALYKDMQQRGLLPRNGTGLTG